MRFLALAALFFASQAQAAISFVSCATTEPSPGRSWTINQPTVVNGDVLIYVLVATTTADANGTPPTGVVEVLEQVQASIDAHLAIFRKVASSEASTLAFTNIWASSEGGMAVVCAYRGVDNTTPMDATAVSTDPGSVTSISGPSITSVTNNAWILQIASADPAGVYTGTDDASPNATERFDATDSTTAVAYVFWQDYELATAGPLALDVTALTSDTYQSAQLALRPAAGGGGGGTAVAVIRQVNP